MSYQPLSRSAHEPAVLRWLRSTALLQMAVTAGLAVPTLRETALAWSGAGSAATAAEMAMSAEQAAFATALAAFQKALPHITKSERADTGKFSYGYAPLDVVSHVVLPLLAEQGLSFTAAPTLNEAGVFVLRCSLLHKDGWRETGDYPLPAVSAAPQQLGSAITYARRYALQAMTGVAPEGEDDDAQSAQAAPPQRRAQHSVTVSSDDDPWAATNALPPSSNGGNLGALRNQIIKAGDERGVKVVSDFKERYGTAFSQGTHAQLDEYLSILTTGAPA